VKTSSSANPTSDVTGSDSFASRYAREPRSTTSTDKTVSNFDVWTFYAERGSPFPYRRVGKSDFGESKFGRRPKDSGRFVGRRVHLIGRSLRVRPSAHPLEVIEDYLSRPRTNSAKKLAMKAVIVIDPVELRGKIAWDPR